ncbi:MAG: deoxyribodipyrimidine photo-lyase [Nitriliruptoraceae bacterium]
MATSVMLFTRDLRVEDNPALVAAAAGPIMPLFVADPAILSAPQTASRRCRVLTDALETLGLALARCGAALHVRVGDPAHIVAAAVRASGADTVHLAADVSRYAATRGARIRAALDGLTVRVVEHPGITHVQPGAVTPAAGRAYLRFTPYYRRWRDIPSRRVHMAPSRLTPARGWFGGASDTAAALDMVQRAAPQVTRGAGGEPAALRVLDAWIDTLVGLDAGDPLPASELSPALHMGTVTPTTVLDRLGHAVDVDVAETVARQLCWRDFNHQLLAVRPELTTRALGREPAWVDDPAGLAAWRDGQTGYPLVDAGMRQLAAEGWMPNRVRMIAGSFLSKHLGIDWRLGAAIFRSRLVDGDVANNTMQWQWVAGVGTDSRPRRFFNPVAQARRHDPDGSYVQEHVPELRGMRAPEVFQPWRNGGEATGYPLPIVDHDDVRAAFLARSTATSVVQEGLRSADER